jgi:uncharacterized protein involved in propanediol utilization
MGVNESQSTMPYLAGVSPIRHPVLPRSQAAALRATCGELVQGTLEGIPCLVSCPIERYCTAIVQSSQMHAWSFPSHLPKFSKASRRALECLPGAPPGGSVSIDSDLPYRRGYGSSTADIGAALFALGEAASLIAHLHQLILFNPLLETALRLARQVHAVGVCRAHSGTLIGLLLDPTAEDARVVLNFVRKDLPQEVDTRLYSLTGGEPRYHLPLRSVSI